MKMRIMVHNTGKEPVVFRSRTWHHIEPTARMRRARRSDGVGDAVHRSPLVVYRLEPDGCIELASPGIGIGKYGYHI